MEPLTSGSGASQPPTPPLDLRGSRLCIPNLQPIFASWKQGINPLHGRVKKAVDARLDGLISGDEKALAKIKAADIGLFAAGYVNSLDIMPGRTSPPGSRNTFDCRVATEMAAAAAGYSRTRRMRLWRRRRSTASGCSCGTTSSTAPWMTTTTTTTTKMCLRRTSTAASLWRS